MSESPNVKTALCALLGKKVPGKALEVSAVEDGDLHGLYALTAIARQATLTRYETASCVMSVRVVLAVMEPYGLIARPSTVNIAAFNKEGWANAQAGTPLARWPRDAHSVGVDSDGTTSEKNWNGHLVAIVRSTTGRILVDPSADQLDRPQHNIHMSPVVAALPRLWTPKDPLFLEGDSGTTVVYTPKMLPKTWQTSPDWARRDEEFAAIRDQALRQIEKVTG